MTFEEQVRCILNTINKRVLDLPIPVIIDTWFRSSGAVLSDIEDEDKARALIENAGNDTVKKFMVGDYFWHPECVKCARCRKHVPECRYSELCNRCDEVLKGH